MAGKTLFCELDCSQAYHCLPMADQRLIEMLAFNFASRTFAYRRLAQGLGRASSTFSSFMREYLDKVIKTDQCAQYVDDIGIAANDAEQLMKNPTGHFAMDPSSRAEAYYAQMPFWCNGNRFPGSDNFSGQVTSATTTSPKYPRKQ